MNGAPTAASAKEDDDDEPHQVKDRSIFNYVIFGKG